MKTKLLAIMFTDISGYTAFSSSVRRESMHAAVKQQQKIIAPIIERFNGHLIKWIGDAAMAKFESATDSIFCGKEIQKKYIELAERGSVAHDPKVKVVVNIGDVGVDSDGDIYGEPVNLAARIEKCAEPYEVYFSEAVHSAIPQSEIPHEFVGDFKFKGISFKTPVYRTCFGKSPVLHERIVLVKIDFVSVLGLSDKYDWDIVHPIIDEVVGLIKHATRDNNGTFRTASGNGILLTFASMKSSFAAIKHWLAGTRTKIDMKNLNKDELKMRIGIHWGNLHIMEHTMMGRDIHIIETLTPLGHGNEILITGEAKNIFKNEELNDGILELIDFYYLRECNTKMKWLGRYDDISIYKLDQKGLDSVV